MALAPLLSNVSLQDLTPNGRGSLQDLPFLIANKQVGTEMTMQPALICPAYVGFYSVPISWFSIAPDENTWRKAPIRELLSIVHEGQLAAGIKFRVRRDGFIWFDCNNWEPGTYTEIPAYDRVPGTNVPREVTAAELVAEGRAYNRSMLINAFQFCLNVAHVVKRHRSTQMSAPVQPRHLIHLSDFENPISPLYNFHPEPYCIYVDGILKEFQNRGTNPIQARRLVEHDVVAYSFELLDKIMASQNEDALKIVELLYWGCARYYDCSFADSLVLAWTACEKIINSLWANYLRSQKETIDSYERINKDRLKKLGGRDFSASVVTEFLELSKVIPFDLFRRLDETRKKRNAWLHSLESIDDIDASKALMAAGDLFKVATGITIRHGLSRTVPGTGGMPKEMYKFPELVC